MQGVCDAKQRKSPVVLPINDRRQNALLRNNSPQAARKRPATLEAQKMSIDPLIPFAEAIAMAGMKTTKAYEEVKRGRLAVVRNGRRTFVRASELQRYIDSLTTRAA